MLGGQTEWIMAAVIIIIYRDLTPQAGRSMCPCTVICGPGHLHIFVCFVFKLFVLQLLRIFFNRSSSCKTVVLRDLIGAQERSRGGRWSWALIAGWIALPCC